MPKTLVFISVAPSPYQRDVFTAIARRGRVGIRVHYQEQTPPDSPWPEKPLCAWESILPGGAFGWGSWRSFCNRNLPVPRADEFWVLNGSMSDITTQRLMRRLGSRTPWAFWGETPSRPGGVWRKRLQRWQYAPLRCARHIAAIGERAKAAYRELIPGASLSNRPYACDLSAFIRHRPDGEHSGNECTFLFCGQMIRRKGIDLLLNAFAKVAQRCTRTRLLLVGREAELPALLAKFPGELRGKIHYAGFQAPESLPRWFAKADVFVLPSRHDGWGVVVNQAIGAGLPCIVSDAVGASELLTDGVHGQIIPADNEQALARAMGTLAVSPAIRAKQSAAVQRLIDYLSPSRAAAFWEEIALGSQPDALFPFPPNQE